MQCRQAVTIKCAVGDQCAEAHVQGVQSEKMPSSQHVRSVVLYSVGAAGVCRGCGCVRTPSYCCCCCCVCVCVCHATGVPLALLPLPQVYMLPLPQVYMCHGTRVKARGAEHDLELLQSLGKDIIVLTDADQRGRELRVFLDDGLGPYKAHHAFVPISESTGMSDNT